MLKKKYSKKLNKSNSASSLTLDNMDQGMEDIYYDRNTDEQTTASGGVLDYIAGSSSSSTALSAPESQQSMAYDDLYASYAEFSPSPSESDLNIGSVETANNNNNNSTSSSLALSSFSMPSIPNLPTFKIEKRKSKVEKLKEIETEKNETNSGSSTPRGKCKADDIPVMDSPLRRQLLKVSANMKHHSPVIQSENNSSTGTPEIRERKKIVHNEVNPMALAYLDGSNSSTPKLKSKSSTPFDSHRESPINSVGDNDSDDEMHARLSAEYSKAVRNLSNILGKGITVLKYDSRGRPKAEIINCDPDCTVLIWLPANDPSEVDEEDIKETKYVNIGDITSIRLGTDIDPMTPNEALINAAKEKIIPQSTLMAVLELKDKEKKDLPKKASITAKTVKKASSLLESFFVSKDKDLEILYGTEVLRDNCTPEQMKISFALFTDDRVLNIQCLEQKDYDILVKNLKIVISPPPSMDHHIAMKLGKNPMKGQVFGRKSWKERSASAPIRNKKTRSKSIGDLDYMESREELLKKYGPSSSNIKKSNSKDDQDVNLSSSSFSMKKDEAKPLVPTKAFIDFMAKIDVHALTPILYEQNRYYGTNMYTTLKPGDEIVIENYLLRGYTMEVALNRLFAKHVLRKMNQLSPIKSESGANSSSNNSITGGTQQPQPLPLPHLPTPPMIPPSVPYPPPPNMYPAPHPPPPPFYPYHHPQPHLGMPLNPPPPPPNFQSIPPHPPQVPYQSLYDPAFMAPQQHLQQYPTTTSNNSANSIMVPQKEVKSKDIIKLGVTLFQQEQTFGVNMLDSMTTEDEVEYNLLQQGGMNSNQAALCIFERKISTGIIKPILKGANVDEVTSAIVSATNATGVMFSNSSINTTGSETLTDEASKTTHDNVIEVNETSLKQSAVAMVNIENTTPITASSEHHGGSLDHQQQSEKNIISTSEVVLAHTEIIPEHDLDDTNAVLMEAAVAEAITEGEAPMDNIIAPILEDLKDLKIISRSLSNDTHHASSGFKQPSINLKAFSSDSDGSADLERFVSPHGGSFYGTHYMMPPPHYPPSASFYQGQLYNPQYPPPMYPPHPQHLPGGNLYYHNNSPVPPGVAGGYPNPPSNPSQPAPPMYRNNSMSSASSVSSQSSSAFRQASSQSNEASTTSSTSSSRPSLPRTSSGFSWLFSGGGRSLSSIDPHLTEVDVRKIEDMGFTRDQAVSALIVSNYNVVMAINTLMDNHR